MIHLQMCQECPSDQRLIGTDSLRKYTETMVKGSAYGKHFLNKYRKKSKQ